MCLFGKKVSFSNQRVGLGGALGMQDAGCGKLGDSAAEYVKAVVFVEWQRRGVAEAHPTEQSSHIKCNLPWVCKYFF